MLPLRPSRGLRASRDRPVSQRQRYDMVLLAHISEQHQLSLGSYGRPRMTQELKEIGLAIGHRRVTSLLNEAGIEAGTDRVQCIDILIALNRQVT